MAKTRPKKTYARFRSEVPAGLFRVPVGIPKEMDLWLQNLGAEMKASGGYKLPKTYILRALISAAMELNIDVSGVKTEEELKNRILRAIKIMR